MLIDNCITDSKIVMTEEFDACLNYINLTKKSNVNITGVLSRYDQTGVLTLGIT